MFVSQNYKIQCSETGPRLLLQRLVGSLRETLDNNDLNQVVASSGFSENKGLTGVLSLRAHKTWCRSFSFKDFPGYTLVSYYRPFFSPCSQEQSQKTLPVSFLRMANGVKLQFQNFLRNCK